jgi:hypothetical protein
MRERNFERGRRHDVLMLAVLSPDWSPPAGSGRAGQPVFKVREAGFLHFRGL